MGIRLSLDREPRWHELGGGAAVLCRPATTVMLYAARAQAEAWLTDYKGVGEIVARLGGHIVGGHDVSDDEHESSVREAFFVVALGELLSTDWRGVRTAEGSELAFDVGMLARLFEDPVRAELFRVSVLQPLHEVDRERNFSEPLPTGTSARAKDAPTATDAKRSVKRAPRRSRGAARTTKMPH